MNILEILQIIIRNPGLHMRWLNTLSYLENCGAKLIAESQHPIIVEEELLKHAAEEFRHAYFFKSQIQKISNMNLRYYSPDELLGGYSSLFYLSKLNLKISRFLKTKQISYKDYKIYSYLLVTYAIEVRALEIYQLYQNLIKEHQMPFSISNVIREEKHHLKEIQADLNKSPARFFIKETLAIESDLFTAFYSGICESVQLKLACSSRL